MSKKDSVREIVAAQVLPHPQIVKFWGDIYAAWYNRFILWK